MESPDEAAPRNVRYRLRQDLPYRFRQAVGPLVDRLAKAVGQPTYRLRHTEYVGTVRRSMREVEALLREGGLRWDPLSWYHQPPVGSRPDGSWAYRNGPFADRQLHVVLCARSREAVDVYAHDEPNWRRHPRRHLEGSDIRRERGAEEMRRWLDERGIAYERSATPRRLAVEFSRRAREWLPAVEWPAQDGG